MWYKNLTKRELIYTLVTRDFILDNQHKEAIELKDQLALTEKALELACKELDKVEVFDKEFMECDSFYDYFKNKAKEIMKSE